MKKKEIDLFEKKQAQLEALLTEIGNLAKKTPNDAVNKFKLKFINEVLQSANTVLNKDYKPFESFEIFDEEMLPSNSDVTFILSQYLNCFEKLRADNIVRSREYDGHRSIYEWFWLVDGGKSDIKTAQPKKII